MVSILNLLWHVLSCRSKLCLLHSIHRHRVSRGAAQNILQVRGGGGEKKKDAAQRGLQVGGELKKLMGGKLKKLSKKPFSLETLPPLLYRYT